MERTGFNPFEESIPNKYYTEKVKNSIMFNTGGLLVGLFLVWILLIPAIFVSRRKMKVCDENYIPTEPTVC